MDHELYNLERWSWNTLARVTDFRGLTQGNRENVGQKVVKVQTRQRKSEVFENFRCLKFHSGFMVADIQLTRVHNISFEHFCSTVSLQIKRRKLAPNYLKLGKNSLVPFFYAITDAHRRFSTIVALK